MRISDWSSDGCSSDLWPCTRRRAMPWSTCAASSRPTWRSGSKPTTAELLVQLVLHGIDHVADLVLDLAGRLVDLALVLEVLVVGEVACGFLHPALHVIHVAHVALLIGDLCCLPDAWSGDRKSTRLNSSH